MVWRILGSIAMFAGLVLLWIFPPFATAAEVPELVNTATIIGTGESASVTVQIISDDTPQDPGVDTPQDPDEDQDVDTPPAPDDPVTDNKDDKDNDNDNEEDNGSGTVHTPPIGSVDPPAVDGGDGGHREGDLIVLPPADDTTTRDQNVPLNSSDPSNKSETVITSGNNSPRSNVSGGSGKSSPPSSSPMAQTGDRLAVLGLILSALAGFAFGLLTWAKRRRSK